MPRLDSPLVLMATALPAEAAPLRRRFALERRQPDLAFPVYRNERMALTLSGVGKLNAAAATAALGTLYHNSRHALWLNVGIAGHTVMAIGDAFMAERVTDRASGRQWIPGFAVAPPCPTLPLETVDTPDFDYRDDTAVDMEAAGFTAAARRFADAGKVHCFKVISDNRGQPGHGIGGKTVSRLIEEHLDLLERLIEQFSPEPG